VKIILKISKEIGYKYELEFGGSGWEPVTSFCGDSNEPSFSIKFGKSFSLFE
jgi:hypothetical protein